MKPILKKIVLRTSLTVSMLAVSIAGMHTVYQRSQTSVIDDACPVSAQPDLVIVLDAGHGGIDGGCSTADGVPEKGINLNILLNLRDLLQMSGYKVQVTRDTDRSIHDKGVEGIANQKGSDMDNRLKILNEPQNAVCLSIHQNQFTDPKYSGAQMFYSDTDSRSEGLAQTLQSQFQTLLQPANDREIKLCGKELFLCYYCTHPMVMAECGFLSNPEEAELLKTEEYQKKVAFTLYSGLQLWLTDSKSI